MKRKYQLALLVLLLVPCWAIAIRFDCDLLVLFQVAKWIPTDLTRIYGDNGSIGRFFYSPVTLIFLRPMGYFSYPVVKGFWIALQTLAYGVFWLGLFRLYPFLQSKRAAIAWIFVWIVAINPIHNNFQSNNIQLMLAAVLLWAEVLSRGSSRARWAAGVLCGLTAAVKIYPLFLVALYFLTKPREVKAGIGVAAFCAIALPFLYFGGAGGTYLFHSFFQNLVTYQADNQPSRIPDILCLPSLLSRWLVPLLGEGKTEHLLVFAILAAIAGCYFYFAWRTSARKQSHHEYTHILALGMALMVLLNPSTHVHYFIFLVPAFASLVEIAAQETSALAFSRWSFFLSVLLVAFTTEGVVGRRLNDQLEYWNIPTMGILLLCVALFLCLVTRTKEIPG